MPSPASQKFMLDYRRWDSKNWPVLDLSVKPAGYGAWCNRARRWLSGGHSEVEQLLELVHLEVGELSRQREAQLAAAAGVPFDLDELNAAIADGIVFAGADDVGARSRAIGSRRGLELWRHLHAQHKGVGPELVQRTVAELLTPERVSAMSELQPALLRLREQLRDVVAAGHPVDDLQRTIALRGILPKALLDRLDDLEDTLGTFDLKLKWVERQIDRAHVKSLTEQRSRTRGLNEVTPAGLPAIAGGAAESAPSEAGSDPWLNALSTMLAAVAKGKGKGKGGKSSGKGGKSGPKGGPGGAAARPPAIPRNFTEGCWHCGDPGHRRQECPKYSAELARLRSRGPPSKGGGKGGGVHELGCSEHPAVSAEAAWYLGQLAGSDEADGDEGWAQLAEVRRSGAHEPDQVVPASAEVQQEGFMLPTWARKRARQRAHRCAGSLAILCRDGLPEPLVAPLSTAARSEIIEAVVDSGAEDSVAPPGLFPGEVLPSPMSREGRRYRAANGSPIPNLGQTLAHFWDADGAVCGIPFQVAQVERPLISVSRMAAAGCRVSFEGDAGEILHVASGRRLPLVRRSGVYVLELRVIPASGTGRRPQPAGPFPRQG